MYISNIATDLYLLKSQIDFGGHLPKKIESRSLAQLVPWNTTIRQNQLDEVKLVIWIEMGSARGFKGDEIAWAERGYQRRGIGFRWPVLTI